MADLQLVSSDVDRVAAPSAALAGAVAGVHALGAGLYARLSGRPGNLAVSPFSVAVALGMTVQGAAGRTATEMLAVLQAPDAETVGTRLNALTAYVDGLAGPVENDRGDRDRVLLDSADAMFGQAGMAWEQGFLDRLARDFGAGMRAVDWAGATEAARRAVNAWTAERTRDRIPEILPAGVVDGETRLVLVDALYLKAPWRTPFERSATRDGAFHLQDGSAVRVPMMSTDAASYVAGPGFEGATLSYAGGALAMTVLLPDPGRHAELEDVVAGGGLAAVLAEPGAGTTALVMPRWTFRSEVLLKPELAALGMPTAFTDRADFSAMTREERLGISEVLHQVFVAVDEFGTEAAAATAVVMTRLSAAKQDRVVTLDRPFLFAIHDTGHGTPLFLGRVADPGS